MENFKGKATKNAKLLLEVQMKEKNCDFIPLLTDSSDLNSSIVSNANFVDRNTGVISIFVNSDSKHTRASVTNIGIVQVELIHVSIWICICTAVKRHSRAT